MKASATSCSTVLIYDPRKGDKIAQRLSLQGHPSEKTDFFIEPKTNEVYGFIRFARTEGEREVSRVLTNAATDKDGNSSETLIRAKQERLDNWRTLQELAGTTLRTSGRRPELAGLPSGGELEGNPQQ
ncbi:MAG: hypothetical protein IT579_04330, partial [Verrucomicrobia subdivision 3 bacterium]|nr:hypothetical protein [Limisphaerales bacterium]